MTAVIKFELAKDANVPARLHRIVALFARCGARLLAGMHEARRRQAARIIADERYLAGLGGAAHLKGAGWDVRPKVVPLRRAPATQPLTGSSDAPLGWPQGEGL